MNYKKYKKYSKENLESIYQQLSALIPELRKLHSQFIEIADPVSHEVDISFNDLIKKFNYKWYDLYFLLNGLEALNFIKLPHPLEFHKAMKVKIYF